MNRPICVCGIIAENRSQLTQMQTRVIIIMHARERKLTTNTARLAAEILPDCEIRIRGDRNRPLLTEGLVLAERQSLLLYPCEEAVELTPEYAASLARPVTLIVPDGSWRQASKVSIREPSVERVPRVKLALGGPPSAYKLRREPNAESICTFEAITRAVGILEGATRGPAMQEAMEHVFDVKIERSLWARGKIRAEDCRYPIPQEAFDQFHRDGVAGGKKRFQEPLSAL
jgi:DTW domain-containing protein YfiP